MPDIKVSEREEKILEAVKAGAVKKVRGLISESFWQGAPVRPGWGLLSLAVHNRNRAMTRLLSTYGAKPKVSDLKRHRDRYGEDMLGADIEFLKQCGLNLHREMRALERGETDVKESVTGPAPTYSPLDEQSLRVIDDSIRAMELKQKIPEEWRKVLKAAQDVIDEDAMIAGGALRDTFNRATVKDVDIFLASNGMSNRQKKKRLMKLFEAAGLEIVEQSTGGPYPDIVKIPKPDKQRWGETLDGYDLRLRRAVESWVVRAGPDATEYNFVFLNDKPPKVELLMDFDFGICQIGYDGNNVIKTPAYEKDVHNRTITLCVQEDNPRDKAHSREHLKRIKKKYPDWKCIPENMDRPPPQAKPRRVRSTYWGSY